MHLAAWLCSRVKFICHERGGVSGGLLPVLPDCRPVCGEPVRSGAGKGCYGKSWWGYRFLSIKGDVAHDEPVYLPISSP